LATARVFSCQRVHVGHTGHTGHIGHMPASRSFSEGWGHIGHIGHGWSVRDFGGKAICYKL
jgi:hypothetical protein